MSNENLIEAIDLLFDFQYTIPGSRKGPVFLRAGERFRLLEKKSENWYLVSRLETAESFYVPVVYSELVKLSVKKTDVIPPRLPAKPKKLLEKLQNDVEVNPPSPPVIEDSLQIELFKLLSTLKPKTTNSYYFKNSLYKSDSHVNKIPHEAKVLIDFKSFKKKDDDQFNLLPKVPSQPSPPCHHSANYLSLQPDKSAATHHPNQLSQSLTSPKPDHSPKSLNSTKTSHSPDPLNSPKFVTSPPNLPPKPPAIQFVTSPPNLPPKPPATHYDSHEIYTDELTGRHYCYNPLTNESSWVVHEVEYEGGGVVSVGTDGGVGGVDDVGGVGGGVDGLGGMEDKPELPASNLSKSGPLNRTKLTEGGRKLKKYWYCTHAVLQGRHLSFFKDNKSTLDSSRADLVLDLMNSLVLKGGTANKQNLIQVITNTGSEYLLQSNDQSEVQNWFQLLSTASSLDSTKDVTLDIDDDDEDLNTNPRLPGVETPAPSADLRLPGMETPRDELQKRSSLTSSSERSKLMERLRTWLSKRPSEESLRKKGIYQDAIFGSSLSVICGREASVVPNFVINCIQTVEERGLKVDGIYRISGNMSEIQKLRMAVDSKSTYDMAAEDIHVVTGALKMFLRELREPVVPFNSYEALLKACYSDSKQAGMRTVLQTLPQNNYETLKGLLSHLLLVMSHSRENRMQVTNLSIIFGPTLLWPREAVDASQLAASMMQRGQSVELLLRHFDNIFL